MSNLAGKTSRDYLAGFNPHRTISEQESFVFDYVKVLNIATDCSVTKIIQKITIKKFSAIAHNVNIRLKFAREIQSILTATAQRALTDLKYKVFDPVFSGGLETQ